MAMREAPIRALIAILCVQFSGALPIAVSLSLSREARANDASSESSGLARTPRDSEGADDRLNSLPGEQDIKGILVNASKQTENLAILTRRAKYPSAPATPKGGVPTLEEQILAMEAIIHLKREIEDVLKLPAIPPPSSDPYSEGVTFASGLSKLYVVYAYLNTFQAFITLRIALKQNHDSKWMDTFVLRAPRSFIKFLPGLGKTYQNRIGDIFHSFKIDSGPDGKADPVAFRPSESLIQSTELGMLADVPSEEATFTLVQYAIVRQLQTNLDRLRYLRKDRRQIQYRVPPELTSKLSSLGLSTEIAEERHLAKVEPDSRRALFRAYDPVAMDLPSFVTPDLSSQIAAAIPTGTRVRRAKAPAIHEVLTKAELEGTRESVFNQINKSSVAVSPLNETDSIELLRNYLTDAKVATIVKALTRLNESGVMPYMTEKMSDLMLTAIDRRKQQYIAQLSDDGLRAWLQAARTQDDETLYAAERRAFIEELVFSARDATDTLQRGFFRRHGHLDPSSETLTARSYADSRIDLEALFNAYEQEKQALNPRPEAEKWMYSVIYSPTYRLAREEFGKIMVRETSPSVLVGGVVSRSEVESFLSSSHPLGKLDVLGMHPSDIAKVIERIQGDRHKTIRDFFTMGEWLGFTRVFVTSEPGTAELLTDNRIADAYFSTIEMQLKGRLPIYSEEVEAPTSDGRTQTKLLSQALLEANPEQQSSDEVIARVDGMIDQALIQAEEKALAGIQKTGSAKSFDELDTICRNSMALGFAIHLFPEHRAGIQSALEDLSRPKLSEAFLSRFIHTPMFWGTIGLMSIQGLHFAANRWIPPIAPVLNVVKEEMAPLFEGAMMKGLTVVILADIAHATHRSWGKYEQMEEVEDFYAAGGIGTPLVGANELAAMHTDTLIELVGAGVNVAFLGGMAGIPVTKLLLNRGKNAAILGALMQDMKDFSVLGIPAHDFSLVEKVYNAGRSIRGAARAGGAIPQEAAAVADLVGGPVRIADMTPEQFAEFERAALRLLGQIRDGKTYALPNVILQLAQDDAFKALGLKPGKWKHLDKTISIYRKGGHSDKDLAKAERAYGFLKGIVQKNPEIVDAKYVATSPTERRLVSALGRSKLQNLYWDMDGATQATQHTPPGLTPVVLPTAKEIH